jgi:hypothetical protein
VPVLAVSLSEQRGRAGSRFIRKRIAACLVIRSVEGALNTIDGYEAMLCHGKAVIDSQSLLRCLTAICDRSKKAGLLPRLWSLAFLRQFVA